MIAEGLSDDLTFTMQGFENYEVIPSQELGKQLKAYATLNPDIAELRAAQSCILASSYLEDVNSVFVYTEESFQALRRHCLQQADKSN